MGLSGADLEYQKMLADAGIVAAIAQGHDAPLLEQLELPDEDSVATPIYYNVRDYGALGVGTDDTVALQAAVTAALPNNGTVFLPHGTYGLTGELQLLGINRAVALVGEGQESSVIKALHANARVTWGGQVPTGPGLAGQTLYGRPGLIHSWGFDGNSIATRGITVGVMCAHSTWMNIQVLKCNGDGIHNWSQNCDFIQVNSGGHSGNGWVIDYGSQACSFIQCHGSANDGWDFEIRQSGGSGWGASSQPQNLKFVSGICEQGGSPYFLDTGLGGVHIREGLDITFDHFELVNSSGSGALVLTPSTANGFVGRIVVRDCRTNKIYVNANSGGVAQTMGGTNEPLLLDGWNTIQTLVNGSTGFVYDTGFGIVTTYTAEGTGAASYLLKANRAKTVNDVLFMGVNSAGVAIAQIDASGNVWARNGQSNQVKIGDVSGVAGISFFTDTHIQRNAAAGQLLTNQLVMRANAVGQVPTIARGFASQTADLFQAQDSALAVKASITKDGAVKPGAFATGSRPTPASVGESAMIYDTTLDKPIWSDGTNWRDAAGTIV